MNGRVRKKYGVLLRGSSGEKSARCTLAERERLCTLAAEVLASGFFGIKVILSGAAGDNLAVFRHLEALGI